jgi:AcrR family transcriptional regulator
VTSEILAVARTHLARDGAAALSLRSIARDLQMAPSALYRYFSGRDALLSALILGAYESVAEAAAEASDAAYASAESAESEAERWMAVPRAVRSWALGHPHEWGLIFGSPVPGYEAPQETVVPYARLAAALIRPIAAAQRSTTANDSGTVVAGYPATDALGAALEPVSEALLPGAQTATVVAAMQAWTMLIGLISLELFGHWRNTVLDPQLFFEATVRQAGWMAGLRP